MRCKVMRGANPAICAIGMALPWKGLMFLQNYAGVPTHRKRLGNAEPVETKSVEY